MDVWEKSKTVDPEVRAYVYSLVNAVGGSSTYDDSYAVGDDAVAVLKDITRWLRLYDEKLSRYDVKRCLAEANFVKGDLLEILAQWPEEATENTLKAKLALACLQLLVPLSWPPELDQNIFHDEKFTVNHSRHLPYLQLAQVGYKRAMLHFERASILRTAVRIALPAIAQPRRDRSRRDEGIIKLVLYLFRNLAFITQPQHLPSQGDENEISRSSTIEAFREQDVFTLLLTIGSSANDEFQDQDTVLLEILYHLLKGVDAGTLFLEQEQMVEKETDELQNLMHKEKAMLNNYKKFAPSRHNRFGTMIWVKRGDDKYSTVSGQSNIVDDNVTLKNMDSSKKWNKPKYRGKTNTEHEDETDFGMRVELTETARKHLREFVSDFLDSSFNPLFSGLRKAIERQADRVGAGHQKQYFYLAHWFLHAESARREQIRKASLAPANRNASAPIEENTFAYIAAVLDQETFVLLNRNLQRSFDEKNWQDLQATLLCFTQILLTVQSMAESKDEEDQEIAENIQSRIFYEETTHDLIVRILRGYTHQGFAYLDAITECVHVFVRMLERYSKQNVDLHIRSKRRSRKKQKQQAKTPGEDGTDPAPQSDAEDDAEDEREAQLTVSERKFDFARFSARFLSQGCVDTFIALTHFYQDLSADQLKRCHRFFYRLAFKQDLAVLLFRVDILQLFHNMIKGRDCLSTKAEGYREWEQLIQQVFRRCIKWVERASEGEGWRGAAVTEMLFSKIPNTLFYLQNGYDVVKEKRLPRVPDNSVDLQIKETVEEGRKVSVAVALMLEKGKKDSVSWVSTELARALEVYRVWEAERTAAHAEQELLEVSNDPNAERTVPVNPDETSPAVGLIPDSDERKALMLHDQHLRLLLTTLGLERPTDNDDANATWYIPSNTNTTWLSSVCEKLSEAESSPPTFENGKTAQDMLRKAPVGRKGAIFSDDEDSGGESGGEINPSLFPPNIRSRAVEGDGEARPAKKRRLTPRNKTELTDAEAKKKAKERRKREQERNGKIKSALYITADDDASDEEADAEFFRLEEQRRKKTAGLIRSALLKEAERIDAEPSKKSKGKKRKSGVEKAGSTKRQKQVGIDIDEEDDDMEMDLDEDSVSKSDDAMAAPKRNGLAALLGSDEEDESEQDSDAESAQDSSDTDSDTESDREGAHQETSSQRGDEPNLPLNDVSGNARAAQTAASDDEDDAPMRKPAARRNNLRAGFIIDSDSE